MFWIFFTSLAGIGGKLLARENIVVFSASGLITDTRGDVTDVTTEVAGPL